VVEALRRVYLPAQEILHLKPASLSGGMRKRVGIARALALEPEIVLFDEPNSGLDPVMSDAIDKLILRMQQELGLTFIVISHDLEGTFQIADRIAMLYKSKLIAAGDAKDIRASDNPVIKQFFSRSAEGPIQVV
jgi:phospholipid/cholesterol/gamma-HCH transport system ATP-binding protein